MACPKSNWGVLADGLEELCQFMRDFQVACDSDLDAEMTIHGEGMSSSLINKLHLHLMRTSKSWAPNQLTGLKDIVEDIDETFEDLLDSREPTVIAIKAYCQSLKTFSAIQEWIFNGVLHDSRTFRDGQSTFDEHSPYYIREGIYLEAKYVLSSPGMPHMTIICIQPQRLSQDKILHTEFWTLCYWARRYMRRAAKYVSMPVRLVSICDMNVRIVSADFSQGYLSCLRKNSAKPQGLPVRCDVSIGPYRDMQKRNDYFDLMAEIISIPKEPPLLKKEDTLIPR